MEMIGKTPEELDRMTLSEIAVACIDPEKPEGSDVTMEEAIAYLDRWKTLTPLQKLFDEAD